MKGLHRDFSHSRSIREAADLKRETNIGDYIEYKRTSEFSGEDPEVVKGRVIAKYPFTFKLDTGQVFNWIDYMVNTSQKRSYIL